MEANYMTKHREAKEFAQNYKAKEYPKQFLIYVKHFPFHNFPPVNLGSMKLKF